MFIPSSHQWANVLGGGKNRDVRVPFYCCSASFTPFEDAVCTAEGHVFDILNIIPYIYKYGKSPVTGKPLAAKDLIRLQFHKNAHGEYHCPVLNKVFTEFTHIVAVKPTGNVFSYEAVQELNIKPRNWRDLLSQEPFTRDDIITIQDPSKPEAKVLTQFDFAGPNSQVEDDGGAKAWQERAAALTTLEAARQLAADGNDPRRKLQKPIPMSRGDAASVPSMHGRSAAAAKATEHENAHARVAMHAAEDRIFLEANTRMEFNSHMDPQVRSILDWRGGPADASARWQHYREEGPHQRPALQRFASVGSAPPSSVGPPWLPPPSFSSRPMASPKSSMDPLVPESTAGPWTHVFQNSLDHSSRGSPRSGPQNFPLGSGQYSDLARTSSHPVGANARLPRGALEPSAPYAYKNLELRNEELTSIRKRGVTESRHGKAEPYGKALNTYPAVDRHLPSKHQGYNAEAQRSTEAQMQTRPRGGRRQDLFLQDVIQYGDLRNVSQNQSPAGVPSALAAYYRDQPARQVYAKAERTPRSTAEVASVNPATSAMVQRRGKERLVPKKKKLSALKKVILKERAARTSAVEGAGPEGQSHFENGSECGTAGTGGRGEDSSSSNESAQGSEEEHGIGQDERTHGEESVDRIRRGRSQGTEQQVRANGDHKVASHGAGSPSSKRDKKETKPGSAEQKLSCKTESVNATTPNGQDAIEGMELNKLLAVCQRGGTITSAEQETEVREALQRLVLAQHAFVAAVGGGGRKATTNPTQQSDNKPTDESKHGDNKLNNCAKSLSVVSVSSADQGPGFQSSVLASWPGPKGVDSAGLSSLTESLAGSAASGANSGGYRSAALRSEHVVSGGRSSSPPQVQKGPGSAHSGSCSDAGKGSLDEDAAKERRPNTYIGPDVEIRYCKQIITTELNRVTSDLLKELLRFQERAKARDPVKAKKKRRLVVGLREVSRAIRTKRAKSIIVAPNIEEITSEGGLDCTLQGILEQAEANDVTVVFALTRSRIAQAFGRRVRMSTVAICDFDGANDVYKEMLRLAAAGREQWAQVHGQIPAIQSPENPGAASALGQI